MAPASVTLRLERVNASPRIRLEPVGVSRDATAWPGRPERVWFRGATRLCRGAPNVGGLEERPGCAGALRTLGGLGGHFGAPHVTRYERRSSMFRDVVT